MKKIGLNIAGKDYDESAIASMSTHRKLWDGSPSVGNCVSGTLEAVLWLDTDDVPRNAQLTPYVIMPGAAGDTKLQKGRFFVFSRAADRASGALSIVAYDAIYKAEAPYATAWNIANWPRDSKTVMQEIAQRTGTTICAESLAALTANPYAVQFPGIALTGDTTTYKSDGTTTMREVAGWIASMYAGNWIIDNNGEWRLIQLGGEPEETNYLVTENGDAITLGGVRILVG